MLTEKKLISLVVPVFNEELNVEPLYAKVMDVIAGIGDRYDFELVFTDNHSTDTTFQKLRALHECDRRVRVFRFSRNFGYQKSILTGYLQARGDAVIQLDCDLQDPPEMIVEFLKHWEVGCEVVFGVRKKRQEHWLLNLTRLAFYRLVDCLSEDHLPVDAGDFRLIDRKVVEVLRQMDDSHPYLRGAIATVGFCQLGIPYERHTRERGRTNFSAKELIGLAIDGILNHSIIPLRVASFVGIIVSLISFLSIVVYSVGKTILGYSWPAGFTTLTILVLAGIGLNALFLGIIGEYLGRIYQQVKKKPLVVIDVQLDDEYC
jgi:glycosyltransferase involved in cell wall biosynthesis